MASEDTLEFDAGVVAGLRRNSCVRNFRGIQIAELSTKIVKIPNPSRLVETCTQNQIARLVPASTHDLVVMPCQHHNLLACLPVDDAHSVIVTCGENPGQFGVEGYRAHVVCVEGEFEGDPALVQVLEDEFGVVRA